MLCLLNTWPSVRKSKACKTEAHTANHVHSKHEARQRCACNTTIQQHHNNLCVRVLVCHCCHCSHTEKHTKNTMEQQTAVLLATNTPHSTVRTGNVTDMTGDTTPTAPNQHNWIRIHQVHRNQTTHGNKRLSQELQHPDTHSEAGNRKRTCAFAESSRIRFIFAWYFLPLFF